MPADKTKNQYLVYFYSLEELPLISQLTPDHEQGLPPIAFQFPTIYTLQRKVTSQKGKGLRAWVIEVVETGQKKHQIL